MTSKVDVLKEGIKIQREWGNHKVADLLAAELAKIPECWLKLEQRDVLEALCKTYDTTLKEVMIEQTLDWARRTDGYADLNRDMRKKLGKECDESDLGTT